MIRPRSGLIGTPAFPGMVTESGELVILAVQRGEEHLGPGETSLAAGDTLLVEGTWEALEEHLDDPDVLVVDAPELVRRQAVPMGPGSRPTLAVLAAMVVLLATGAVPAVVAGLLAAGALLLLRRADGGPGLPGRLLDDGDPGGGDDPALHGDAGDRGGEPGGGGAGGGRGRAGPYALIFGLVLLTVLFGQMISNMATALIVIPIAISVAARRGPPCCPC